MRKIYITNGCPFSGKSTWAVKNFVPEQIIESDLHKYDSERNGKDLTEYLATLALNKNSDCVLVQTNNSFNTFKKYYDLLHNDFELVIVNFNRTPDELRLLRDCSDRVKKSLKKEDRIDWYWEIWNNSLNQIRTSELWHCLEIPCPQIVNNDIEGFLV